MSDILPRRDGTLDGLRASPLDPTVWQQILGAVRAQHPSLNRTWFDQMVPRQLTNGVIQVTCAKSAELNFCQSQCQQPFTAAAQQVTGGDHPGEYSDHVALNDLAACYDHPLAVPALGGLAWLGGKLGTRRAVIARGGL